jgi:hypothetical protein
MVSVVGTGTTAYMAVNATVPPVTYIAVFRLEREIRAENERFGFFIIKS